MAVFKHLWKFKNNIATFERIVVFFKQMAKLMSIFFFSLVSKIK